MQGALKCTISTANKVMMIYQATPGELLDIDYFILPKGTLA